ncbi:stress responsive A/B barrel domain-containing protein [Didymella exigua CBS 183.55]|uniref:Stress responsive A/B barrel domain-containing protein n=1 Tax=Didymella exigua CBS 183.55 TaxID=1150837 RepID=A0A6A5R7D6_9PLEO|nr:stress responsive A/B barrel domain-containing protein [Didymella exigua CBS 183.55]KAF1923120.1 stress responsive A/B barrel domain-containing protein [Didymella exigua CBS 183.55]
MSKIVRMTLFKLSDNSVIKEAIQKYSSLTQDALKDGKPYIQQAAAHQPYDDPRSQDYTLVARTVFNSKADMDYYDNECEAHAAIKTFIKPKVGGPPLVIYMDA